jgi:hypothetical protein
MNRLACSYRCSGSWLIPRMLPFAVKGIMKISHITVDVNPEGGIATDMAEHEHSIGTSPH